MPVACQTLNAQSSSTTSSFGAACKSTAIENLFRMLDAKTWERSMTIEIHANRSPADSARQAMTMAMAGMTPAQRAEAQKELADLPSQADSAKQVLQALRKQMNGTAVQQTIRVKERWTLVSAACSTAR